MNRNYYAIIPADVRYDRDLSPNAKLLYGEITALSNAEGYCWATNNYFAELYDVTKRSIQGWISQLEKKSYIRVEVVSVGHNDSSRKIYLNNRGEKNYTGEKNDTPPRKKVHGGHEKNFTIPHEENCTHNNTSFNTTINNTKNINNKSDLPEIRSVDQTLAKKVSPVDIEKEFKTLWKLYPRKIGKKKAFDTYKKARKVKKIPYETIQNGLYRYIRYLEQQGTEEQYIMHGSTWFNQEKWQDEYITTGVYKKPKNSTEYLKMKYGGNFYEPNRNGEIIEHNSEVISEFL